MIPGDVLSAPTPAEADAQRSLVLRACRALGVATLPDIADYFRLPVAATRARLRELVAESSVSTVSLESWAEPAYLHPQVTLQPIQARALLSPFDSLLWERRRTERLFGFRHVFELYVKPERRRYGYNVLPFLLGDKLVARVDLKADRTGKTLMVLGAFVEPGEPAPHVAEELATELRDLAAWLDLHSVDVLDRGDLAADLRSVL